MPKFFWRPLFTQALLIRINNLNQNFFFSISAFSLSSLCPDSVSGELPTAPNLCFWKILVQSYISIYPLLWGQKNALNIILFFSLMVSVSLPLIILTTYFWRLSSTSLTMFFNSWFSLISAFCSFHTFTHTLLLLYIHTELLNSNFKMPGMIVVPSEGKTE